MEKSHKDILIRLRKNIIDDLDIDNNIILPLRKEYNILSDDDIKDIYIGTTKEERAGNLLDILPRCGPSAFDAFHQSLKHHYEWLSDEIDKVLGNYEIETNGEIDYYARPFVPPQPPLTVTREDKINQLKIALQQLIPAEYIALHGMKGFGKACLVSSTLKDAKLVKDLFSDQVYWIKFSCNRLIDEEILIQLNTLYHNVRNFKNLEFQPELYTRLEKESLILYLKLYFEQQKNWNALLILDDVYDEMIINTFDFKCKTLVLTADIDVLHKKRPKIIEMNGGFTEAETLGLFATVLEMEVNKLPIEAKRIHEECKGMPMLIAMFAAQFEDFKYNMRAQPDKWRYYLKSLREKDTTNKVMRKFLQKQKTIFDMCIEQLKLDLKTYYESLAIFCEDVNITPKTLAIFWEQSIHQVEELMLDLCHKSLVAKKWNKDLETNIYGVHDLLLWHLRKKQTQDELIQMHRSIITKYWKYCNNDFSKLPDDNYIYSYIGYHLEQARLFEEFPNLYLNFDFIQSKLIYAGLNDLLLDLKMYRKYITLNYKNEYVKKISDLERFLEEQASIIIEHKRKKCLDIIQIAIDHPYEGYIAQTAKTLAITRQEYLYLSQRKSVQYVNMVLTEEIPTDICTSSFTDYPELILTGNTSGKIILWNCQSKQKKVFNGHREGCPIKKVIVSMDGDCFLALNSAGIIKLFHLFNENDEIFDEHKHTGSPRQKQSFWSDIYTNSNNQDDSLVEFRVKNEIILDMAFGHEDKYIAACTDKATIQIWDRHGRIVFTLRDFKYQYISKIAFTEQGSLLHIMNESNGAFALYSNCGNYTTYRYLTCYNLQLKSASEEVIFFHHIPRHENSLMVVTKKEALYVKWWWNEDCVHSFNKQRRGFVDNDTVTYVCATITYDGEYIILADSAGFINVWNTYSGYQAVATYKSRVIYLDSYWLKDEGFHIICGNEKRVIYRWKLPVQESDELPRKCLFDAIVSCDEKDIIVKESPSKKIIALHEGNITESEFIEGKILNLQLFADGNKAVYVTDNQKIQLLDIKTGSTVPLLTSMSNKPIQFVKIINLKNCNMVLCRWEDSNLKVWQQLKFVDSQNLVCSEQLFEIGSKTESINDVHIIKNEYVTIVTQNGIITIWQMDFFWKLISQVHLSNRSSCITFSRLSYNQNYLAILNESHHLTLLHITYYENVAASSSIQISEQPYFTYNFEQMVTCCDISKNELYIAVGFKSGQISIFDIHKQEGKVEIAQLSFHANPITQLYWAPATISVPILLSLTSDELVWWNIVLAKNNMKEIQKNKRNRMGQIRHSLSTPSFNTNELSNPQVSSSRSVDADISNLQDDKTSNATDTINNMSKYWKNKIGKNPKIPELLAVVELPPSRDPKICISLDFTKFVMVDMYGSVNTFKLLDYNQLE